jgi:hypothetical protein
MRLSAQNVKGEMKNGSLHRLRLTFVREDRLCLVYENTGALKLSDYSNICGHTTLRTDRQCPKW